MNPRLLPVAVLTACSAFDPNVGAPDAGAPSPSVVVPAASFEAGSDAASRVDGGRVVDVEVGPGGQHVFRPKDVEIAVGDTVRWIWRSSGHAVTSGAGSADGQFCSPENVRCDREVVSQAGSVYEFRFVTPGVYPYLCVRHADEMVGSVTVR